MFGQLKQVLASGNLYVLTIDSTDGRIQLSVEAEFLHEIVGVEGLASPHDLVGRQVEVADDGSTITIPHVPPKTVKVEHRGG
jgi:hypothetical protein